MWWNNVETKPGTGYPTAWEDQKKYKGGWEKENGKLEIRSTGKAKVVPNIFHNPHMPSMDDYYEPWTCDFQHLFNAPEGDDQPTAIPISMVTGEGMKVEAGPNWDDGLSGSPLYAANDPNLEGLTEQQRLQLSSVERLVFFYLPRICNHCLNPCCVAACPSGALYKRGEDGIVLIEGQRSMILDPHDPHVIAADRQHGIQDGVIESAQDSPVYKMVNLWKIALPPHIEHRTLPMLFYVPPLAPVQANKEGDTVDHVSDNLFHDIDEARVPMKYFANLFGAGNEGPARYALAKQKAVRWHRRAETVGDIDRETANRMLREADCNAKEAEAIYQLTALCTFEDRFVIPPMYREQAVEMMKDPHEHRQTVGFGFSAGPTRGL